MANLAGPGAMGMRGEYAYWPRPPQQLCIMCHTRHMMRDNSLAHQNPGMHFICAARAARSQDMMTAWKRGPLAGGR